jgi:hypothetical protein
MITIDSMFNELHDCNKCLLKNKNNPRMLKQKGCNTFTPVKKRIGRFIFDTCPGRFAVNVGDFLLLYSNYQKGILPENKSLFEQCYKNLILISMIELEINEQREKREKRKK